MSHNVLGNWRFAVT